MRKLQINNLNIDLFKALLNKVIKFDKDKKIFITVKQDITTSNVYFKSKDAVKIVQFDTSDIFEFEKQLEKPLKIAFYNAGEIISELDFYKKDNTKAEILYDVGEEFLMVKAMSLKNDIGTSDLFCLDANLSFMDMSQEAIDITFQTDELNSEESDFAYFANFNINHTGLKDIEDRLKINKTEDKLTFKVENNKIYVVNSKKKFEISDSVEIINEEESEVTIYKKYLTLLDKKENYRVFLCSNKVIFESLVLNSKLAITASIDADLETVADLNYEEDDDGFGDLDNLTLDDLEFDD